MNKLITHFKISKKMFKLKFCHKTNGFLHLKETKNGNCLFLKNKKCTVYKFRPTQCRTWPFWPEIMNSKQWNKEVVKFCPGIGKGKLIKEKKINEILESDKKNEKDIYNEIKKTNYQ